MGCRVSVTVRKSRIGAYAPGSCPGGAALSVSSVVRIFRNFGRSGHGSMLAGALLAIALAMVNVSPAYAITGALLATPGPPSFSFNATCTNLTTFFNPQILNDPAEFTDDEMIPGSDFLDHFGIAVIDSADRALMVIGGNISQANPNPNASFLFTVGALPNIFGGLPIGDTTDISIAYMDTTVPVTSAAQVQPGELGFDVVRMSDQNPLVTTIFNADLDSCLDAFPTMEFDNIADLSATGESMSGSFPGTQDYIITNSSATLPLPFTVAASEPWISLSTAGAAIPAGGMITVTVSIDEAGAANALAAAALPYTGTVTFTNTTNGRGNTTRDVDLTVTPKTAMVFDSAAKALAIGVEASGSFPGSRTYTITNPGSSPLTFTAVPDALWVEIVASATTIAPGGMETVTVSVDEPSPAANNLTSAASPHTATVTFTNTFNGLGNTTRDIMLTVTPAALPTKTITPATHFSATGLEASSSYLPASLVYTITNDDAVNPLTFTAARGNAGDTWFTVTPAGPTTIPPSGTAMVTVAIATVPADALPAADLAYVGTVEFTNTSNPADNMSRTVVLTVKGLAAPIGDPLITAPGGITTVTDPGLKTAVVDYSPVISATDPDGSIASLVISHPTGTAFPIGTTTVTVTATDNGGNISVTTFDVTVLDAEKPVFDPPPQPDISVDVTAPTTTAAVAYAVPTATDNSMGAVTIDRTVGPASGAPFPLGPTIVTHTATDPAGNVSEVSFTVTVNQIALPTGTIEIAVISADNGTFGFTSPEPALSFSLTAVGGTASSGPTTLGTATYSVTIVLPSGLALTAGDCNDGSPIDVATRTATIVLTAGEDVICTFTIFDVATRSSAGIANFITQRNNLILTNGPTERILRLDGVNPKGGTSTGFVGIAPQAPFGFNVEMLPLLSGQGLKASFSSSYRRMIQAAAAADAEFLSLTSRTAGPRAEPDVEGIDLWTEGHVSLFNNDDAGDGDFAVFHLGTDYVFNRSLMIGVALQYDYMKQGSAAGDMAAVEGHGWMIGPNIGIRLAENLFFEVDASAGRSYNKIKPVGGATTDEFSTDRWLARARLTGEYSVGNYRSGEFLIRPSVSAAYMEDHQNSYTSNLGGVFIPEQTVSLGQAIFGPQLSYSYKGYNDLTIAPHISLDAIWNFATDNGALAGSSVQQQDGVRGKLELGFSVFDDYGFGILLGGNYDGIGDDDFDAYGADINIRIPLN